MARQAKKKAARSSRHTETNSAQKSSPKDSKVSAARLARLERERDEARRLLSVATTRIEELESIQNQVVNRIDWVIDSLHNLNQEKS